MVCRAPVLATPLQTCRDDGIMYGLASIDAIERAKGIRPAYGDSNG